MKKCNRCNNTKSIGSFSKKKDGLQPYCRECNAEYLRKHYRDNKDYYKKKSRNHHLKLRKIVRKIKTETPCSDCNESYHFSQMQFDHLRDKSFTISTAAGTGIVSVENLLKEIDKCEIVCANCHSYRTWIRRQ